MKKSWMMMLILMSIFATTSIAYCASNNKFISHPMIRQINRANEEMINKISICVCVALILFSIAANFEGKLQKICWGMIGCGTGVILAIELFRGAFPFAIFLGGSVGFLILYFARDLDRLLGKIFISGSGLKFPDCEEWQEVRYDKTSLGHK